MLDLTSATRSSNQEGMTTVESWSNLTVMSWFMVMVVGSSKISCIHDDGRERENPE